MFRPAHALLLVVVALALTPTMAGAAPDHKLAADLGATTSLGCRKAPRGVSVAHGWMTLVNPLPPGRHTVSISGPTPVTTIITVTPGQ